RLSLNPKFTNWLGCLASDAKGPSCLQLPCVRVTDTCCYTWLLMRVLGSELRPPCFC
ncbi:hypothetical protein STEG23_010330, partial [Scotinomys teguina]